MDQLLRLCDRKQDYDGIRPVKDNSWEETKDKGECVCNLGQCESIGSWERADITNLHTVREAQRKASISKSLLI